MQLSVRRYDTGESLLLTATNGRVQNLDPIPASESLPWLAPSFFDPQINGCLGRGFVSPEITADDVRLIADKCEQHGLGRFFPTFITSSDETFRNGFARVASILDADEELNRRMPGFHLEGPYLSSEDGPRGAHSREQMRDPDWDEFRRWQDAAGGRIRLVTVAPERMGVLSFIEKLTAAGVVVSLGHTAANGQQIRDAARAGAKMSTHLGNGCHATMNRHENPIWEQLACDELTASIIADGHHLPPSVVKSIVRAKGHRVVLTCDAGNLAGLPAGRYRDWEQELEVLPSGKIVVPGTPYLAGSGSFTDTCVRNVMMMAGVSFREAIEMASVRTRELFGLPVPKLAVGEPLDFIAWDAKTYLPVGPGLLM
jgi:N-acetylglucosamine-6-phosphate deacetylase